MPGLRRAAVQIERLGHFLACHQRGGQLVQGLRRAAIGFQAQAGQGGVFNDRGHVTGA